MSFPAELLEKICTGPLVSEANPKKLLEHLMSQ
jgi:hypothetical protein